jgi:hypothetical protein
MGISNIILNELRKMPDNYQPKVSQCPTNLGTSKQAEEIFLRTNEGDFSAGLRC